MAQFYADIQGNRGEATRMGTKSSGISGHIRGWRVGARVVCEYNEQVDRDFVTVFKTGGSNNRSGHPIAEYCEEQGTLCSYCDRCMNRFVCFTER